LSDGGETENWRGKVGKMSGDDVTEFLVTDVLCRLGCLDDEGWPYVVPIWFQYKDGGVYLIARERSAWAGYLARDPRCFLAMDEAGSQRKVLIKGEAELIEEATVGGRWVPIAEEMSLRYLGPNGPKYLGPTLHEPRTMFFVRPTKMTTWQGVDWAARYKRAPQGDDGASPTTGSTSAQRDDVLP